MNIRGRRKRRELAAAIDRSRALLADHRHEEAFEFLREAVQKFPENAEIRVSYASTLLTYRIDDVAAEAARAVELGPDDPVILVRAGHLLLSRGERKAARSCATRANELVQPDFILMAGLDDLNGSLAVFAGEDELAEEKLRSAIDREPENERFVRHLAVFFAERGRLRDGVAVLDEGLKHVEKKDELERMRARMASEAAAS